MLLSGRRVEEWVRASSLHTSLLWRERKIYLMPTDEVKLWLMLTPSSCSSLGLHT